MPLSFASCRSLHLLKSRIIYQMASKSTEAPTNVNQHGGSGKFEYQEKKGDLFSCGDNESLAHCISADVRMGKGIATIFKKKFGGVDELLKQAQPTGGVAILKREQRFIYYLITKDKYWQKPTYETLTASLFAMRDHSLKENVARIAMPKIGCGLDQLQWPRVSAIIKDTFKDTDVRVTVYEL